MDARSRCEVIGHNERFHCLPETFARCGGGSWPQKLVARWAALRPDFLHRKSLLYSARGRAVGSLVAELQAGIKKC